jgi:glucokinase
MVVLGGNVSRAHHLFGAAVDNRLQREKLRIPVRVAQIGESAALVGAAALWENNLLVTEPA